MTRSTWKARTLVAALAAAGIVSTAGAQTNSTETPLAPVISLSPGQTHVAAKVAGPFASLAGSTENAVALATALRTGSAVTLSYGSSSNGTGAVTTTFTLPTKPMGWGNVSHSLALAQYSLSKAGITNPTSADLQAALLGGSVTVGGKSVTLAGVLQQRASGMGWGKIAQSYGTTMGAVNRGVKAQVTTASATAPAPPVANVAESNSARVSGTLAPATNTTSAAASTSGLVTATGNAVAAGHGSKGVTSAAGGNAGTGHGKGITTAGGNASGARSGLLSAGGGQGQAQGRGIVTASGGSAGLTAAHAGRGATGAGAVTATGAAASGIVSAQPVHGSGGGHGNGKGKGGG